MYQGMLLVFGTILSLIETKLKLDTEQTKYTTHNAEFQTFIMHSLSYIAILCIRCYDLTFKGVSFIKNTVTPSPF